MSLSARDTFSILLMNTRLLLDLVQFDFKEFD